MNLTKPFRISTLDWANSSGGLFYHYLALKNRNGLWSSTRYKLSKLIADANFEEPDIVLIGPSGLYLVDDSAITSKRILAFDLDPFANFFFKKVHNVNCEFSKMNLFSNSSGEFSLTQLQRVIQLHPKARFLFCNILGQLPLVNDWEWSDEHKRQFKEVIRRIKWASFHDRYSYNSRHVFISDKKSNKQLKINDLKLCLPPNISLQIIDHNTDDLFISDYYHLLNWNFTKKTNHIIEMCWN